MTVEKLREICNLTVELAKIRQSGCRWLCVENFAPALFADLIKKVGGSEIRQQQRVMPGRDDVDGMGRTTEGLPIHDLYNELIMAVESKWPDETRHETALRYIQERELGSGTSCSGA